MVYYERFAWLHSKRHPNSWFVFWHADVFNRDKVRSTEIHNWLRPFDVSQVFQTKSINLPIKNPSNNKYVFPFQTDYCVHLRRIQRSLPPRQVFFSRNPKKDTFKAKPNFARRQLNKNSNMAFSMKIISFSNEKWTNIYMLFNNWIIYLEINEIRLQTIELICFYLLINQQNTLRKKKENKLVN